MTKCWVLRRAVGTSIIGWKVGLGSSVKFKSVTEQSSAVFGACSFSNVGCNLSRKIILASIWVFHFSQQVKLVNASITVIDSSDRKSVISNHKWFEGYKTQSHIAVNFGCVLFCQSVFDVGKSFIFFSPRRLRITCSFVFWELVYQRLVVAVWGCKPVFGSWFFGSRVLAPKYSGLFYNSIENRNRIGLIEENQ